MNTRATAISLNSIDEKVRKLEGTSRAVPIDMKSLDDRINNLIATAKSWEIVTVSPSSKSSNNVKYTFDSKYNDWNFAILNSGQNLEKDHWVTTSKGTNNFVIGMRNLDKTGTTNLTYSRSGNVITATADNGYATNGKGEARNLTILFYK